MATDKIAWLGVSVGVVGLGLASIALMPDEGYWRAVALVAGVDPSERTDGRLDFKPQLTSSSRSSWVTSVRGPSGGGAGCTNPR